MNKESSHSGKEPDPYSLNIAIVAGSVVVGGMKAVDNGEMKVLPVGMDRVGWVFHGGMKVLAVGIDRVGWVFDGGMKMLAVGMD